MKVLCYILGFGMLVFALLYADSCSRLRDSTLTAQAVRSVWEADKAISEKESQVWGRKVDSLETAQSRKDSVHTANNASQKKVIARLIRKERQNRPDTSIHLPQDTIYLLAGNLVDSLENQIQELKTVDSVKTVLQNKRLQLQENLIKTCDSLINSVKVPAEPSRLSFGITGGASAVVANNQVFAGPGATIGLQYRIPIKISLRKLFRRKP